MIRFPRTFGVLTALTAGALLSIGTQLSAAQDARAVLPLSPESGSVLMAKALRNGTVQLPSRLNASGVQDNLTCSPLPCVLPNVQASGGTNIANEDPIAANPHNPLQLLTGANDYSCTTTFQGIYASNDGGSTWNHKCLPVLPGGSGLGDPMVGYDRAGNAFAGGIQDGSRGQVIIISRSRDNGTTWSAPIVAAVPTLSGGTTDKGWLELDLSSSSPHVNCLYISNTQFDASSNSEISVSHSCNHGSTWTTVVVDTKQIYPSQVDQFSDLAIAKDGTVYVSWLRCPATGPAGDCGGTTSKMLVSKSLDGGATWSTPVTSATVKLAPDNCGAFYGCLPNTFERVSDIPVIAVDNSTGANAGHLYIVYYNWDGTRMRVLVSHSTNGGTTWSAGVPVAPSTVAHDQFFPWINVSTRGTLGVTWLDRRNDSANINYDSFATFSNNGGTSFSTNQKLSSVMSNPFNDGFGSGFMGDYTGNAWDGATLFASWMDSRNGSFMQDEVGGYARSTP
jgi:hypothetical protein